MGEIRAYHNSQEKYYREPFGAVPCGQAVILRLKIYSIRPVRECLLCLWEQEKQEWLRPMQKACEEDDKRYEGGFRPKETGQEETGTEILSEVFEIEYQLPEKPGPVWYYFRFRIDEQIYFYGNNPEELGGEGELTDRPGKSYQITVYKLAPVPAWFRKGIMYQIYVDRFFNGSPNREIINPKPKSLLHGNWQDTPCYIKDRQGRVRRWTFFGGNLQGVREKLPYLEELGITIIYFNPIFEAASNHKYDTADYRKIDSMYGDEETFSLLVQEAEEYGISIILDGVFSHTGSDSIYFNKEGNYPALGAYQSTISPYYKWYRFTEYPEKYECWWGVEDLPNVNELEPSYQDFIYRGEDNVIGYWMNKGVKGWRLDVADELPDEFIKELRLAARRTDREAVLIGEVWEDASHKISYGRRREYLWGEELDSVTNYPLRRIMLEFMLGRITAQNVYRAIMSLYENYPPPNFTAAMNIIGSHDRARILTLLGEAPAEESLSELQRENYRLSSPARRLAKRRLKLVTLMQLTLPGVPCVYYGDEAGLEGFSDPYNRRTYPWGREDQEIFQWYQRLIRLRKEYNLFWEGEFEPFYYGTEIFGFSLKRKDCERYEEILVCINRSSGEIPLEIKKEINMKKDALPRPNLQEKIREEQGYLFSRILGLDLLDGERLKPEFQALSDQAAVLKYRLVLKPLEGKILFLLKNRYSTTFSQGVRFNRAAGILLPLASVPSSWGIGDMGKGAERFVDFLAASGQTLWQILPLNPLGESNSPYQSPSVFAGNPLLISLDSLQEEGLLKGEEVRLELGKGEALSKVLLDAEVARIDYLRVEKIKKPLLKRAFARFQDSLAKNSAGLLTHDTCGKFLSSAGYAAFLDENKHWLEDYCLYAALKEQVKGLAWQSWDKTLALREEAALDCLWEELKEDIAYQRFLQYTFWFQWQNLKKYANRKGIRIIGDLPVYAAVDSCDTWVNRNIFTLDAEGRPWAVAGVPPDYYSETGQLWGNPLYVWRKMEKDGYSWWKRRIRQALQNYDIIRLDHFRGFEAFWQVPAGVDTAVQGRWLKGPGRKFFLELEAEFGPLPFIAEDLGFLTPETANLKNSLGFPGMKVYQFEMPEPEGEEAGDLEIAIKDLDKSVFYSGTHDNDTLFGWWCKKQGQAGTHHPWQREAICRGILAKIYGSKAPWVILPLQDILGLDSTARLNTPGTARGNWEWRMKQEDLTENKKVWLMALAVQSGRWPAV